MAVNVHGSRPLPARCPPGARPAPAPGPPRSRSLAADTHTCASPFYGQTHINLNLLPRTCSLAADTHPHVRHHHAHAPRCVRCGSCVYVCVGGGAGGGSERRRRPAREQHVPAVVRRRQLPALGPKAGRLAALLCDAQADVVDLHRLYCLYCLYCVVLVVIQHGMSLVPLGQRKAAGVSLGAACLGRGPPATAARSDAHGRDCVQGRGRLLLWGKR